MIVKDGLKAMLDRTYNASTTYEVPTKFKIGSGTTDPTINDTDVETEVEFDTGVTEKSFESGYPIIDLDNLTVKFRLFINSLEANGEEISEVGIIEKGNDTMHSRNVFETQNKTSAVEISIIKSHIWANE